MMLTELVEGLKNLGFQVAYSHFAEGHVPKCPYIVLQGMGSDNFSADGIVYHEIEDIKDRYLYNSSIGNEGELSDYLSIWMWNLMVLRKDIIDIEIADIKKSAS